MEADPHPAPPPGPGQIQKLIPALPAEYHLAAVRGLAKMLDTIFVVPGTKIRFGGDALIGLIPGVGDASTAAVGGYILWTAAKLGVPPAVLARMVLNVGVDALAGVVPVAGDLFDVKYKVHVRNAALLERALADPAGTRRSSRWVFVGLGLAFVGVIVTGVVLGLLVWRWLFG